MRTFDVFVSCILVLQFVGGNAQPYFTSCQDGYNAFLDGTEVLRWEYTLTGQPLFNIIWRYKGQTQVASFLPPLFNQGLDFAGRVTLASNNTDTVAAIEITNFGPDDVSEYYVEVTYGSGTPILDPNDDCTADLAVAPGTKDAYLAPIVTGPNVHHYINGTAYIHVTGNGNISVIVITFDAEPIDFTLEAIYNKQYNGTCPESNATSCNVTIDSRPTPDYDVLTITYRFGVRYRRSITIDVIPVPECIDDEYGCGVEYICLNHGSCICESVSGYEEPQPQCLCQKFTSGETCQDCKFLHDGGLAAFITSIVTLAGDIIFISIATYKGMIKRDLYISCGVCEGVIVVFMFVAGFTCDNPYLKKQYLTLSLAVCGGCAGGVAIVTIVTFFVFAWDKDKKSSNKGNDNDSSNRPHSASRSTGQVSPHLHDSESMKNTHGSQVITPASNLKPLHNEQEPGSGPAVASPAYQSLSPILAGIPTVPVDSPRKLPPLAPLDNPDDQPIRKKKKKKKKKKHHREEPEWAADVEHGNHGDRSDVTWNNPSLESSPL